MVSYSIRNIIIGYTIAIAVVLMILAFTFYNLRSQERELSTITNARQILQKLEPSLVDMQEFESVLNNMDAASRERFLPAYHSGIVRLRADSVILVELANSYPANKKEYDTLAGLVHKMINYAAAFVQSENQSASGNAAKEFDHTGAVIVADFKQLVSKLEDDTRHALTNSYSLTMNLTRKTLTFVSIISGVLILALLISFRLSYRDIFNRLNYNQDLENQVAVKTAEINRSQEQYRVLVEQMKVTEKNLRSVLTSAADDFYVIDKDYRVTLINRVAQANLKKAWGMTVNIGTHMLDLFTGDRKNIIKANYDRVFAGDRIEYEIQDPYPGESSWISINYMPVSDEDGAITGAYIFTRNITERKQSEEALINSEIRFRSLTGNAPVGIFQTDAEGKTIYVNEKWLEYTGMTFEEAKGDGWMNTVHPEDRDRLAEQWYKKAEKGITSSSEYRIVDKEGNMRWMFGKAVPIQNKDGEITGYMGTLSDITGRKRSEETIRKSEERYRALVDNAPEALVVMDVETNKFVSVSESALRLFKMTREQMLAIGPLQVSPEYQPDGKLTSEIAAENIAEAIAGGKPSFEWTHCDAEGRLIPCEVWLVRLPAENQVLIRGSILDITERKRAGLEIVKARELADKLVDSLPGIFYLYDEEGRFIRWNRQFEMVSGYTGQEIACMHPTDFFIGKETDYIEAKIRQVFTEGMSDAEAGFLTKQGVAIPYYFKAIRINYEGRPCLIGTGIDIAERVKFEQQLQESFREIRQLTEYLQNIREQERTHIAREIHDELGQQLTVLKMDISWLSKKINSDDDIVRQKMNGLKEVLDSTVKTVRKIASELRPSLLDDLGLVAAMEWHLKEFEHRSGVKTRFMETEATEPEVPLATKTGLYRIFQESLTNVARHAGASEVNITLQQDDGLIVLRIEDDGIGFDAKKAATQKTLGILGMKERTLMMGGGYIISSNPGHGTTVEVSVPVSQA